MREAGGLYWYSRDLRMGVKLANPGSVGVSVFTRELQFPSVREDDCTRVLCQSWQGYSWVLLTAVPCLWHLCSQPCKHRVCVCVCVSVCVSVCPCVCTCVPEICAKPQYQVSLERWKLQSPQRGMERHPGLQVHQPGIQRTRRRNAQVLGSIQGSSLVTSFSAATPVSEMQALQLFVWS